MSTLPQVLPPPDNYDQSSEMWIDEAIWGHRLYDEQTPWMVFLEFYNVYLHEADKKRAFEEVNGLNTLKYRAAHRLYLRNILFNNPHLDEIRVSYADDSSRWNEWFKQMKNLPGLNLPEFEYLKRHFQSFDDFCDVVSLIRSTSIEGDSNKRWTSKFVFPFGKACLYEDLDNNASTNDRRFFARTGEVLYLMLCRSQRKNELLELLNRKMSETDLRWDSIIRCLQPADEDQVNGERANAFLPYAQHPCFDSLTDDWITILSLNMPVYDMFPHLVNLTGLHLLRYQLIVSQQVLNSTTPLKLICEVVAPSKTLVREISCDVYQENNVLPLRAVEKFIDNIEESMEWKQAITSEDAFEKCKNILESRVRWKGDYDGPSDPQQLITTLRQAAIKRHRQHISNIHRNYGREIGFVSKRGTIKLRYAPTDALLKTLVFTNSNKRIDLQRFLEKVYLRYDIVFGEKEAERVLSKDDFDKKSFQKNARRLEQRLSSLGLLRRLSDGCAYIINPYYPEGL